MNITFLPFNEDGKNHSKGKENGGE